MQPRATKPLKGKEIASGSEGTVYEIPNEPNDVLKEFHPGCTSPVQASNEFQNLERARAVLPDNVVKAQPPADARQGWLMKEKVIPAKPTPAQFAERATVLRKLSDAGVHDVDSNLLFGHTASNPTPRWILVE